jgi:hypothetical protein
VRRQIANGKQQITKCKVSHQRLTFSSHQKAESQKSAARDFTSRLSSLGRLAYFLLLTAVCLLTLNSCDNSFQPYQENDAYFFSIYGYLDVSADTQWVRVAPAREEFNMPPTIPDIRVTLEHLQSGDTAVMNDSLVVPGNGFNYLNFWTSMDINYGQTYCLQAERADGAASRVKVTLPEMFPTPRLKEQVSLDFGEPITYSLLIDDVDKLADVQTWWYIRLGAPNLDEERLYTFSYKNQAEKVTERSYTVFIDPEQELREITDQVLLPPGGDIHVMHRQIYVASAGPDLKEDIASMDEFTYSVPGSFSNVENGLGYMIGIDSKVIPYESCYDDQEELIPCPEEEAYW